MVQIDEGVLGSIRLFRGVPREAVEKLLAVASEQELDTGNLLLSPQWSNDAMFIVLEGSLSVRFGGVDYPEARVIPEGGSVGEISILDRKTPSAFVVAREPTRVLSIREAQLWDVIDDSGRVAGNLLRMLSQWLRDNTVSIVELEQMVVARTRKIEETKQEIINRLGRAAEYKDNETSQHIRRMQLYCGAIGRVIGLNAKAVATLTAAAPMHDVGKIGIPDNILIKQGKLNESEFELVKSHPTIGAAILEGYSEEPLISARQIALTHHEKWDGTGYPNGLKGDEIPLYGRIAAIADVFDALTSKRPFKEAWPVSVAMQYIISQSGVHFDPKLVKALTEALPEMEIIQSEHPDP
ncbi:HD domain-containing phosphohydrolase [Magnetofaba australis]|uniref:Putative Cyclic di-GMP phosphodiesterase response regulator RpfG n=1 Tax=Magnetofaba australis IT-1 TaxID=1434232 RepID=A0A1Y2K3Q4_9PROT|nr:HD domain-containing phosphohydrolase [Magnetofaba australis]OSM01774.1 putative Cyclic di-GMP phosphodiesterase response regulator RpfG [Magnetofaba australis IT-1]